MANTNAAATPAQNLIRFNIRNAKYGGEAVLLSWRKYIRTRPFGDQVGPSTRKPLANRRSPEPSGYMTPI